jgi:hypothetical protein
MNTEQFTNSIRQITSSHASLNALDDYELDEFAYELEKVLRDYEYSYDDTPSVVRNQIIQIVKLKIEEIKQHKELNKAIRNEQRAQADYDRAVERERKIKSFFGF